MTATRDPVVLHRQRRTTPRSSMLDVLVLCGALGVAAINTSWGSIAAVLAIGWVVVLDGAVLAARARALDLWPSPRPSSSC